MDKEVSKAINWLNEDKMIELIENAGFKAHGYNEDEIREDFREHVIAGNISPDKFMD